MQFFKKTLKFWKKNIFIDLVINWIKVKKPRLENLFKKWYVYSKMRTLCKVVIWLNFGIYLAPTRDISLFYIFYPFSMMKKMMMWMPNLCHHWPHSIKFAESFVFSSGHHYCIFHFSTIRSADHSFGPDHSDHFFPIAGSSAVLPWGFGAVWPWTKRHRPTWTWVMWPTMNLLQVRKLFSQLVLERLNQKSCNKN